LTLARDTTCRYAYVDRVRKFAPRCALVFCDLLEFVGIHGRAHFVI